MITVTLWKWGKRYTRKHVARMQSMLSRHLTVPHQIVCITDRPHDLPDGVTPFPMPRPRRWDHKCLRRLWMYSPEAAGLGDRLFHLDLDMVITGNLDAIVNRSEPFVIWKADSCVVHHYGYNPSVLLLTPGARADVWARFIANPVKVIAEAEAAGWWARVNSDQGVLSYLLQDNPPAIYTADDGVVAYRVICGKHGQRGHNLPAWVRIVSFHGPRDPSDPVLQQCSPWIQEYWR